MYINQILQYLLWPAFIIICWFAVSIALKAYEKKFPAGGGQIENSGKDEGNAGTSDQSSTDK
jgi:hypothetical protein